MTEGSDVWVHWLFHQRHGDDTDLEKHIRTKILSYANLVLDAVDPTTGMTLLDIGTGDGLVAFRALERFGPSIRVVLADSSSATLAMVQRLAHRHGVDAQCRFACTDASDLALIDDASVDAVTARSVLAYVPDKAAAFRAIYRVLKPGGKLSIAEPIMRDDGLHAIAIRRVLERHSGQHQDPFLPLLQRWKSAQFPDTEEQLERTPITNYSERDLVRFAQQAGLTDIALHFHIQVSASPPIAWDTFLKLSPHPLAPSLDAIMRDQFTAEESVFFEQMLRFRVESGKRVTTERMAYLTATKPTQAREAASSSL